MKTETQIKFDTILKEGFTSVLKPLSFKKKAQNYYRQLPEVGHIINIQKSSYGNSDNIKFRINIGIFEPKFYLEEYDFKRTGQVPDYPTEPDCLIRKTINDLCNRNDLWYEVDDTTDEQVLISEMQMNVQQYILPFLEGLNSLDKIFQALEKDPYLLDMPFAPLILYGEYGKTDKAQAVYNELLKDVNPLAERTLKEYAKKYKLNV
ncbi:MAG: DUF4304 domain-containing protein [Capnocytophaga sp.]|nr:DUF4304 domain-containing protein [Capnocytophaga sp.]